MGGRGSGRRASYGLLADKVDDYRQIDLAWLKRENGLVAGITGNIHWSRGGNRIATVGYRVEVGGLRLIYRCRSEGDEWTSVNELIPFALTEANYGGRRHWFACPNCRRHCRILYGGPQFRCRCCRGLRYESQYEPHFSRATSQAHKLRERMGHIGSLDDPFPPKPKGMHWSTYRRLEAKDENLRDRWTIGMMGWLARQK